MATVNVLSAIWSVWIAMAIRLSAAFISLTGVTYANTALIGEPALVGAKVSQISEPGTVLCVHPRDPNRLVAGAIESDRDILPGNGTSDRIALFYSNDAGRTWTRGARRDVGMWEFDPACAYGQDGSVSVIYMSFVREDSGRVHSRGLHLILSADGGQTWSAPTAIASYYRYIDRPYVIVDRGQSRFSGNFYINGLNAPVEGDSAIEPWKMVLVTSGNGGGAFSQSAAILTGIEGDAAERVKGIVHPGPSALLADGTVLVVWYNMFAENRWVIYEGRPNPHLAADEQAGMSQLRIARSSDGGRSFSRSVVISRGRWYPAGREDLSWIKGKWVPAVAADTTQGPLGNHVYVAWADFAGGRKQVWFVASSNGGLTWSEPRLVSDDRALDPRHLQKGPHSFQVSIAVNNQGVIGLIYYTQLPGSIGDQLVFVASSDGGVTWSNPKPAMPLSLDKERVPYAAVASRSIFDPREQLVATVERPGGPPTCQALISSDSSGMFHLLALANSSTDYQLYAVRVRVPGTVVRRGELRSEVALDVGLVARDEKQRTLTLHAKVVNTSNHDLRLPITLVQGSSDMLASSDAKNAHLEATNADNGRRFSGAVWDFSVLALRKVLGPGESTASIRLKFRLNGTARIPESLRIPFHIYADCKGAGVGVNKPNLNENCVDHSE